MAIIADNKMGEKKIPWLSANFRSGAQNLHRLYGRLKEEREKKEMGKSPGGRI